MGAMQSKGREVRIKILVVLIICIIAGILGQAVYVISYNNRVRTVEGRNTELKTHMDIHDRDDTTSEWVKRDYNLNGTTVNLKAKILDGTLVNNSQDNICSWNMTIRVTGDCMINQAWCGTMEIHQNAGSENEIVQTLDLRNYNLDDVKLKYLYDGDMLIPLSTGDYMIYYPSEKDKELDVPAQSNVTIGLIYYYVDTLDVSDYSIEYRCHKSFTEGIGFIALISLTALTLILIAGQFISDIAYRNATREMRLRQSGVASMSDIYSVIYDVDLENDQLTSIHEDEGFEDYRQKDSGAREQLLEIGRRDADESYRKVVEEFMDISTIPERLEGESIACEYFSREHGWMRIRFFPVRREEDQQLKKVIFTLQDIDEEKTMIRNYAEQVEAAERENRIRTAYILGVSGRLRTWLQNISDLDEKILEKCGEGEIRTCAEKIHSIGRILSYTMDGGSDASRAAAGNLERLEEEYSPKILLADFLHIARTMTEGGSIEVKSDIAPDLPAKLRGDIKRIERVMFQLLSNAVHFTKEGSIRLAVYGKAEGEKVHLLLSVKDTGGGLPEESLQELEDYIKRLEEYGPTRAGGKGHGLEVAASLLNFLGSRLEVISTPGRGTEFYFEIEQEIVDSTPIVRSENGE